MAHISRESTDIAMQGTGKFSNTDVLILHSGVKLDKLSITATDLYKSGELHIAP